MQPRFREFIPMYIFVFSIAILLAIQTDRTITVMSQQQPTRTVIILDAGHGGEDGGAISCSGVEEAQINLQITLRLDDLLHLLGYETKMLRSNQNDLHTEGTTISQRKNSDLRKRTELINETANAVLVSIHQNQFSDNRYHGAQVFWANTEGSQRLAEDLQRAFISTLNPGSKRAAKQAKGIYIMEHIQCTGILVECGFLSNPTEEAKLRSNEYQKKLVCVIASSICRNLYSQNPDA